MRGVVFDRSPLVRVDEIMEPEAGHGEVLIRVARCGICSSDLHLAHINPFDLPYPFIPGHEAVGVVDRLGQGVTNLKVGDRVVIQPAVYCSRCRFCRSGHVNLCENLEVIGLHRPGGFAEYLAVPAQNSYDAAGLPDAEAACTEPLACALHGLERLGASAIEDILVFGAGTIGLFFLQVAIDQGAVRSVVVDLHPHRLDVARQLGADEAILADGSEESLLTSRWQYGFDCVVDATGVPSVVANAIHHVRPGGRLLILGSCPTEAVMSLSPRQIQRDDVTIAGAFSFGSEFLPALRLLREGRIRAGSVVTHCYSIADALTAFEQARLGNMGIKIQIATEK